MRDPALPKDLLGWNEDPIATKTFIVQQGFFTAVELYQRFSIVILRLSLRASITHRLFEVIRNSPVNVRGNICNTAKATYF